MGRKMLEEQKTAWNGAGARGWIEAQQLLDRFFQPFEDMLVTAVASTGARRVIDVGCGTGATTLAAARQVGSHGEVLGVDISETMIAAATARAGGQAGVRFICADAETYPFEPAAADLVMSRFGVMFFLHPEAAFANLRAALKPGAALRCLAWRGAEENPFMTAAERAAAPLLPRLPARTASGPGQFAFADANAAAAILERSGWQGVEVRPVDAECSFPSSELVRYITQLGPVGRALQDAGDLTRARVVEATLPAFSPFVDGAMVRLSAACWMLCGRA